MGVGDRLNSNGFELSNLRATKHASTRKLSIEKIGGNHALISTVGLGRHPATRIRRFKLTPRSLSLQSPAFPLRNVPTSDRPATAFRAFWRCCAQFAGVRLWFAVALQVTAGVLEAYGLLLLLPLLHVLGIGTTGTGRGMNMALAALKAAHAPLSLSFILGAFVLIKATQSLVRAGSGTLNHKIETDFGCFLRDRFYRAMMGANWLFITRTRNSELSDALLTELPMVAVATRQVLMLLSAVVLASFQIVVAFELSPLMTTLALGSGAIVGLGLRRLRQHSFRLAKTAQKYRAEMAAAVHEHLAGLKVTKSHGREPQQFSRFSKAMQAIATQSVRLQRVNAGTGVWTEIGAVVALALFVYVAIDLRRVNPAHLLVLVFIFMRLLGQVSQLQMLWHQITNALPSFASAERLRAKLLAAAEPEATELAARLPLESGVHFDHVTFRYDVATEKTALYDIVVTLPVRQVTALCGPSGAGKSTFADLLLGLLAPSSGTLWVDSMKLEGERLQAWRQSIGYVPQETFLFHDTIRANLLWAEPNATEAELRMVLRAAAAETFVSRLPHGLDTIVGDRGVRLSGGERQRIALARALLRRPALLVLDEATSSLDTVNERMVQDAIERLQGETTILVIAHRLSTVRFADRIIVLDQGRIVETGAWNELSDRKKGVFRRLLANDRIMGSR